MTFADGFTYRGSILHCGSVNLSDLAGEVGTPTYVYNLDAVLARFASHRDAFAPLRHQTCFAVKANCSLAVLQALAHEGCGFDVNSRGELQRCLRAGASPSLLVMTGVGKSRADIEEALVAGVGRFNVESASECRLISDIATERNLVADVLLRLNPDIETGTHPYISTGEASHKFGLSSSDIRTLASQEGWLPGLRIVGLSFHLGSQITSPTPYRDALRLLLKVLDDITPLLPEPPLVVDIGGGFGVPYDDDQDELSPWDLAVVVGEVLGDRARELTVISEPGRSLVANAGVLIASVEHVKPSASGQTFLILDAGMNDLLRPALYQAKHAIIPIIEDAEAETLNFDIVGPVCESSDTFAVNYPLPSSMERGRQVAILSAGAYGAGMSSTYNSRPLSTEVVVRGDTWFIARHRQSIDAMLAGERLLES